MNLTIKDITAVTYNWMQKRLTLGAIANFRKFYPDTPLLVIDAGRGEKEMEVFNQIYGPMDIKLMFDDDITELRKRQKELNYKLIELGENLSHGSLTDYAVWEAKTPLLVTMDNDVRLLDGNLLQEYLDKMNEDEEIYSVGHVYHADSLDESWVGLWFSLWKLAPIKKYHLTFGSYLFHTIENKPVFIETGAFVYHALKDKFLHRTITENYKTYKYPQIDDMKNRLLHLKARQNNEEQKAEWLRYVDGI